MKHIKMLWCFCSQQPVLGNCRYQAHGCRKVGLEHNKLQEHEKICTYQIVECYNKCKWRNYLRHLATHLREVKLGRKYVVEIILILCIFLLGVLIFIKIQINAIISSYTLYLLYIYCVQNVSVRFEPSSGTESTREINKVHNYIRKPYIRISLYAKNSSIKYCFCSTLIPLCI